MEEFCGQTTYLFVAIDQNNFVPEIRESDNGASLGTVTMNGLNCDPNLASQDQDCKSFVSESNPQNNFILMETMSVEI